MAAYYNEFDPFAAQWLRNLISAGHIAPGDVDERSITEVSADDLKQYNQCHFFAGIGVWSHALRHAGWPDSRPVWTGSCPCQPFSVSGKKKGTKDERHLWPAWFELVEQCQPTVIFGEQVASSEVVGKADGSGENVWLDIVSTDLERASYACAPFDLPASSFGAPHIRQRMYFVAARLANEQSRRRRQEHTLSRSERQGDNTQGHSAGPEPSSHVIRMGDADIKSSKRRAGSISSKKAESSSQRNPDGRHGDGHSNAGEIGRLANGNGGYACTEREQSSRQHRQLAQDPGASNIDQSAGPTNGFWRDPDWLGCRDGKFRPVEPGTFPLANGATQRVGRLRAYGNAICPQVAAGIIGAYMNSETAS